MQTTLRMSYKKAFSNTDIESSLKEFFISDRPAVIFGAGTQAKIVDTYCRKYGKKIFSYMVSSNGNPTPRMKSYLAYMEYPLYTTSNFPKQFCGEVDAIVAIHVKFNDEIVKTLKEIGFKHIFTSSDWEKSNVDIDNDDLLAIPATLDFLSQQPNVSVYETYYETGDFKFLLNVNTDNIDNQKAYMSACCGGGAADCLYGALFNDLTCTPDGPYELDEVHMKSGDIVLDLGANIGLFTCLAASKQCKVYTFEVVPYVVEMLKQNIALYKPGAIILCPYAVSNETGEYDFYYDDNSFTSIKHCGIESGSLFSPHDSMKNKISVPTIRLDDWAEINKIDKIDFIKSDIEGSERDMLAGARNVLANFAPKLALSTYHFPDDKEVMSKIILDANPQYKIEHRYSKLYAYVP